MTTRLSSDVLPGRGQNGLLVVPVLHVLNERAIRVVEHQAAVLTNRSVESRQRVIRSYHHLEQVELALKHVVAPVGELLGVGVGELVLHCP